MATAPAREARGLKADSLQTCTPWPVHHGWGEFVISVAKGQLPSRCQSAVGPFSFKDTPEDLGQALTTTLFQLSSRNWGLCLYSHWENIPCLLTSALNEQKSENYTVWMSQSSLECMFRSHCQDLHLLSCLPCLDARLCRAGVDRDCFFHSSPRLCREAVQMGPRWY